MPNLGSPKSLNCQARNATTRNIEVEGVESVENVEVMERIEDREAGSRSGILLRIDAKFLQSRKKGRAVHSEAGGSAVGTTHAPFRRSERPYELIPLPFFILVAKTGCVAWRVGSLFDDLLEFAIPGAWYL
jgi:hypothetical protein